MRSGRCRSPASRPSSSRLARPCRPGRRPAASPRGPRLLGTGTTRRAGSGGTRASGFQRLLWYARWGAVSAPLAGAMTSSWASIAAAQARTRARLRGPATSGPPVRSMTPRTVPSSRLRTGAATQLHGWTSAPKCSAAEICTGAEGQERCRGRWYRRLARSTARLRRSASPRPGSAGPDAPRPTAAGPGRRRRRRCARLRRRPREQIPDDRHKGGKRVRLPVGPQRLVVELERGRAARVDAELQRAPPRLRDERADRLGQRVIGS